MNINERNSGSDKMNPGFSIFKLCAAVVFIIVCFLLVMEKSNLNKTAEITGMDTVIEQTKRDISGVTQAFRLQDSRYASDMGQVFKRQHNGYTLYISCLHRGPLYGFMTLGKDIGDLPRNDEFRFDQAVPPECRQKLTSAYNRTYHRGHLFAANHFDNKQQQMDESFYMSNIVPQHNISNTGAWKTTEVITECYREYHHVYLAAGVLYGSDTSDDYFQSSHGVTTPTAMWKYIQLDGDKYIAWIIPNNDKATKESIDKHEVTIEDLQRITNIAITNNTDALKRVKMPIFNHCHIS